MVAFTQSDLQFILDGIVVSETHANATNDVVDNSWVQSDIETSRLILRDLLPNSLEPVGMRTISGELNNLEPGQDQFGATGNEFPRVGDANYVDDGQTGNTETGFDPDGPGPAPAITNTDYAVNGNVIDSDPRLISNLIADLSLSNAAAAARAEYDPLTYNAGADGLVGTSDDVGTANGSTIIDPNGIAGDQDDFFSIPNVAPDEGLSAPFNGWMTMFGQFFDHGLDLIAKGDNGTVIMPLADDDPLIAGADGVFGTADDLPEQLRFMTLTRATVDAGADGILGTADDVSGPQNFTSPFVDQNQTYTSHPSHQIFLREYAPNGTAGLTDNQGNVIPIGAPVSTGGLIEGVNGGMGTWGDVKAQAASMLGIELTDAEAVNIPTFAVDQYGEFIRGANGLPQYVLSNGTATTLVEGDLANPVSVAEANAIGATLAGGPFEVVETGFAFLLDIARNAAPVVDANGNLLADADTVAGNDVATDPQTGQTLEYDDELLDAHFIAGDGRANENFGLTAVHHVFHQEHNRVVEHTKETLLSSATNPDLSTLADPDGSIAALDLLNGYLEVEVTEFPVDQAAVDALVWDGDRLFQAAKFATEMQYQHLVFEEFGRKVQPAIDLFASFEPGIDASISMEFSQAVYRFGHSMLTETVDLMDTNGNLTEVGLVQAFLNPIGFNQAVQADGTVDAADIALQDSSAAAGALIRGMTRQTGSEIDEFVTDALRDNLLGLPLDLAAINIARGRDVGLPTLNELRATVFESNGDTKIKPYDSWADFAGNLKNELSIVNFVASYGQHETITSATTIADKRAAAFDLVVEGAGSPADRVEFLNSTGAWADVESGLNLVDLWIGGLAEATEPFGGMLGSTFNFIFEQQMEDLQDGDRFYYLGRVAGLNFLNQLEQNSFANMIIRNTDIGDNGGDHLPGDIFSTPGFILEVDQSLQVTGLPGDDPAILNGDPVGDSIITPDVVRDDPQTAEVDTNFLRYNGGEHVVLGGTEEDDTLISSVGDDTLWGDGGDDTLEGGDGGDILLGGAGDDIITDIGGLDNIQGQDGNDAIFSGAGEDLILAGAGKDFVLSGPDLGEVFAGSGDDFVNAGTESNIIFGNEGNDWLEGGGGNNLMVGDNGAVALNSTISGHDVFIHGQGDDDYDAEGGDDIMTGGNGIQRFEGLNGFDWATYRDVDIGVNVDMLLRAFDETPIVPGTATILDRFDSVEGLSGGSGADILRGDDETRADIEGLNNGNNSVLSGDDRFSLINGLREGDNGGLYDAEAIFQAGTAEWGEGDIILGGAGSDLIEGRGGDDIIDGDLSLHVRLLATDANGNQATAFKMEGQLFQVDANGDTVLDANGEMIETQLGGHNILQAAVFDRVVNPGNLEIVREILNQTDPLGNDTDTVEFNDVVANFTIEGQTFGAGSDGVLGTADDVQLTGPSDEDGDGFISVQHDSGPNANDGQGENGTDLVRNVERLSFTDATITLGGNNGPAEGAPVIVSTAPGNPAENNPAVGDELQVLFNPVATTPANPGDIFDPDGIPANAQFIHTWQVEDEPGVFIDLLVLNAEGDDVPLRGEVITVPLEADGLPLRVVTQFQDADGVIEEVASAATNAVAPIPEIIATNGDDFIVGTPFDDVINALGGNDTVIGLAGNDEIRGASGADTLFGGAGEDVLIGNSGGDTLSGEADNDRLLGGAGGDTLFGGDGEDVVNGGRGTDTLDGGAGADRIAGGNGADTAFGGAGDDRINGGNGNDELYGDAGADRIVGGNGHDEIDGGEGNDILVGGDGFDVFFFGFGGGNDRVNDFEIGIDQLDVQDGGLFFDELTIATQGNNLLVTHTDIGDTILLVGLGGETLTENDFIIG